MTVDVRLETLRTAVTELIAFESDLEARLERERDVVRAYPGPGCHRALPADGERPAGPTGELP